MEYLRIHSSSSFNQENEGKGRKPGLGAMKSEVGEEIQRSKKRTLVWLQLQDIDTSKYSLSSRELVPPCPHTDNIMANSRYQRLSSALQVCSERRRASRNLHAPKGRSVGPSCCAGPWACRRRLRSWKGGGVATAICNVC